MCFHDSTQVCLAEPATLIIYMNLLQVHEQPMSNRLNHGRKCPPLPPPQQLLGIFREGLHEPFHPP